MRKYMFIPLLALFAIVVLAASTPASASVCDEGGKCENCATCIEYVDGGFECTGCPRPNLAVTFSGEGTAKISIPLTEELLGDWGFLSAPTELSLAPIPGIFSVDFSRVVASSVDGVHGQTVVFEVTLAPGVTPEMVLGSLRSEGYLTVNSPNGLGEILIPVQDLLSPTSFGLPLQAE